MPSSITTTHNNTSITFTEEDHSYIDQNNIKYTSVTTLISRAFAQFDAENIAKKKAVKEGRDWKELVYEWQENGKKAAAAGTRLHENCEHQILGEYDKLHNALSIDEKIKFDLAFNFIEKLKKDKRYIKFEPEKLVFSPALKLAGSVDLLATKKDGSYTIFDWKNIKEISKLGFNGKCGIIEPTKDIQDSNYWHYNLQLQIYEIILKVENYIPKKSYVDRILNVFEHNRLNQYELEDMKSVAKNLIRWNLNYFN